MVSINIRELSHNFSKYLNKVKSGKRIVIMERNTPVADIIPHNENIIPPLWRREIERVKIKGASSSLSNAVIKNRREERN